MSTLDLFFPLLVLADWFREIFGAGYAPMFAIIVIVGLLREYLRTHGIATQAVQLRMSLSRISKNQKAATQLYPGGALRFAYGKSGLFIDGGNLHTRIAWHAFQGFDLLKIELEEILAKRDGKKEDTLSVVKKVINTNVDADATHLRLTLKIDGVDGTPFFEFLLIPRKQFFPYERNAIPWEKFVEDIKVHVPRFQ